MMGFFRNLLGARPDSNIEQLLENGALIVDVRTEREFKSGHVRGSVNIPLDTLQKNMARLKKKQSDYHLLRFRD